MLRNYVLIESESEPPAGIKAKIMAPYVKWKLERDLKRKKEALAGKKEKEEEPKTTKAGLSLVALLALIYTIVMAIFFFKHYSAASDAGEGYLCINEDISLYKPGTSVESYSGAWIVWMKVAFWNFVILTLLGILSINGAFFPELRKCATFCGCLGTCFHLFTIIALTIVRFNIEG